MKFKKVYLIISIISILSASYSCNSPGKNTSLHDQKILLDANAAVVYVDKKDNQWFASKEKGIYKYDGNNLQLYTSKQGLDSYHIISVQEDNLGHLYFDTPEGVFKYNDQMFIMLSVVEVKGMENRWNSEPDDLWFSMGWNKSGPYRYDGEALYQLKFPKSKLEDEFYQKYPSASFNPYGIYSIYRDSKGNIWFGTSNMGIYIFDGQEISWMYEKHLSETPEGGNFGIRSIIEDKDGNYWICNTKYKYSLLPNNPDSKELKSLNYTREIGIEAQEHLYYLSMHSNNHKDILMATYQNGVWLNNGKVLTEFFILEGDKKIAPTSVYTDRNGIVWLGTANDGIYKYDGNVFKQIVIE